MAMTYQPSKIKPVIAIDNHQELSDLHIVYLIIQKIIRHNKINLKQLLQLLNIAAYLSMTQFN